MKELLALKSKFGMTDPRTAPDATPEIKACTGIDFISRVGGEIHRLVRGGVSPSSARLNELVRIHGVVDQGIGTCQKLH